ncbi:response regulator [Azoarcus communis]|uniref:DNA-binding response regulator n=1 Tax=Parazoarcus communis SWub3 = DSM 12120 TaxID=1121029 RepID=A0A323V0S5_9RHOO|nr:response regulator transcription factor [Parazoarcus communis]NMG49679.1 response regulator [Parazoarcus communis]NMG71192.1 response regulator [Parazoarcus communis SWub3 = DSM 12120]PZA17046.1 DNA-binding response regulator [Azoarcus communis] [Parazoarcus communis SWub3 = DSM 12120]
MIQLAALRIVLADDHAIVRMGFRLLVEGAGAHVVAEADSGEAAVAAWNEHRPDVLIMDVSMPGIGGLGALERLLAHHPQARVLMLSAHEDTQIPARALQAGATGYLSKRAHPDTLLRAIADVASGRRYLDPELAPKLALARLGGGTNPVDVLTGKEFSVFLQLARGRSVAEVAETLKLSTSTVGTHLYHIKQKLNASNAAELALIAVRAGLVDA